MKFPRRRFLHLAAGAASFPTALQIAWAQSWPNRTVRRALDRRYVGPPGRPRAERLRHHPAARRFVRHRRRLHRGWQLVDELQRTSELHPGGRLGRDGLDDPADARPRRRHGQLAERRGMHIGERVHRRRELDGRRRLPHPGRDVLGVSSQGSRSPPTPNPPIDADPDSGR